MSGDPIVVTVDRDLEDLIPGFMSRRHADVVKLQAALAGGDFATLRVTGHSLKGTGGGYGFDGLSEIGGRIEESAKAGDGEALQRHLGALSDYLSRVQVRFQ